MSIINTLPIELWNIILINSDNIGSKNFIFVVILYKIFNNQLIIELRRNYIYDYIINISPINYSIYNIYNNLELINSKYKYIIYYNKLFQNMISFNITDYNINDSIMLRDYLYSKIKNEKDKTKFENLTARIILEHCRSKPSQLTNMLNYLN